MNKIEEKFNELKKENKKALIIFLTVGCPNLKNTEKLIFKITQAGVDMLELGIPFSDPLADGPSIQWSSQVGVKNKISVTKTLTLVKKIRPKIKIPLILLTYFNPVYKLGLEKFVRQARLSGVDGVIIPDLIPEEAEDWIKLARKNNLASIFLAAPTSSRERLKIICAKSTGFIYYVSLTGVTGAREKLEKTVVQGVKKIKRITKKPVAVGFGISTPQQARKVARWADGVIVGSALVNLIKKNQGKKSFLKKVEKFVKGFRKRID